MNNFLNSFTGFTKFLVVLWSLAMFTLVGSVVYGSFQFGTALWMWRPVDIIHQSTHIQNGILYKDTYHVIIK